MVGNAVARPAVRPTNDVEEPRLHGRGCVLTGAWDRREYGDLQFDRRGIAEDAAGRKAGATLFRSKPLHESARKNGPRASISMLRALSEPAAVILRYRGVRQSVPH